jgi:hypothetical protein
MNGEIHKNAPSALEAESSHLKAQNDLLALKLLHEPDFMERVPLLTPFKAEVEHNHPLPKPLEASSSFPHENASSWSSEFEAHGLHETGLDALQVHSSEGVHEASINALSAEVLERVRDHLDDLLPDLIASTLEEVLRDWSSHQMDSK